MATNTRRHRPTNASMLAASKGPTSIIIPPTNPSKPSTDAWQRYSARPAPSKTSP
jgi:hypothetical protein